MDKASHRYPSLLPFTSVQKNQFVQASVSENRITEVPVKDSFEPQFGWRSRHGFHRKTTFSFPNRDIKTSSLEAASMLQRAQRKLTTLGYLQRDVQRQGFSANYFTEEMLILKRDAANLAILGCDILT